MPDTNPTNQPDHAVAILENGRPTFVSCALTLAEATDAAARLDGATIVSNAEGLRLKRIMLNHYREPKTPDTGRYQSGYRIFRDGSYREDFGGDR